MASALGRVSSSARRGALSVRSVLQSPASGLQIRLFASTAGKESGARFKANALVAPLVASAIALYGAYATANALARVQVDEEKERLLLRTFYKHASVEKDGNSYMTVDDLIKCLHPHLSISPEKLKALFLHTVGTTGGGMISFEKFREFYGLLYKPDADYYIAFMAVDADGDGFISKEEFKTVINANMAEGSPPFNFHTEWVNLFFGSKGDSVLSYEEFTQLLKGLQLEKLRQEFRFFENKETGLITGDEFLQILQRVQLNVPPGMRVPKKIREMENLAHRSAASIQPPKAGISYAQIVAFTNLLLHIPSYGRVLQYAMQTNGTDSVTKEQFMVASVEGTSIEITPLEVDLIYLFFDLKQDGKLDLEEISQISSRVQRKQETRRREIVNAPTVHKSMSERVKESALNFGMGAIAGGIGATAVYPIDLVKTRMQNQRGVGKAAAAQGTRLYDNSIDCFRKVLKNEGFKGLYKGLGPQLVGVAPEKAIKLAMNDLLRDLFQNKDKGQVYLPLEILAGGGAGASQVIFTNPLEIIKIRLQIQGEAIRRGLMAEAERQGAISIIKELGFAGLYKGAGACLLRDVPFSGIYFPLYAKMKTNFAGESGTTSGWNLLLAGAIAGAPAASLTTPADVIKTRLQVKARAGEVVYNGIRDAAIRIMKEEGFAAFWKGALARVVRSSPQFGVTLLAYELLHGMAGVHPSRPPTNAPVDPEDLILAFGSVDRKLEKVETRWFNIFKEYGKEDSTKRDN